MKVKIIYVNYFLNKWFQYLEYVGKIVKVSSKLTDGFKYFESTLKI